MTVQEYAQTYLPDEIRFLEQRDASASDKLTIYEQAIIYKYSNDGYEAVNEFLRFKPDRPAAEFVDLLTQCLNKLPDHTGLVFRGVNLTIGELTNYLQAAGTGRIVIEPFFISVSTNKAIAYQFGRTVFRLYSKRGKYVDGITRFNEKEVIFVHHTSFRILSVEQMGERFEITMIEL